MKSIFLKLLLFFPFLLTWLLTQREYRTNVTCAFVEQRSMFVINLNLTVRRKFFNRAINQTGKQHPFTFPRHFFSVSFGSKFVESAILNPGQRLSLDFQVNVLLKSIIRRLFKIFKREEFFISFFILLYSSNFLCFLFYLHSCMLNSLLLKIVNIAI